MDFPTPEQVVPDPGAPDPVPDPPAPTDPPAPDPGAPDPVPDPPAPTDPPAPDPANQDPPTPDTPAPDPNADPKVFDATYVKQLRDEAAETRVRLRDMESKFEGVAPEALDGWAEIIRGLSSEETRTEAAQGLFSDLKEYLSKAGVLKEDGSIQDQPLTAAQLEQRLEKERQAAAEKQQQQEIQAQITKEIKDLGYEPGTPDHSLLLHFVMADEGADLQKAHAAVQAHNQAIIDNFVKEQQAGGQRFPKTPDGSGSGSPADPGGQAPKTFEDARAGMRELLKNLD